MSKRDELQATRANRLESMGVFPAGTAPAPAPSRPKDPRDEVLVRRAKDVWDVEVGRIIPDPSQPRKEFDPEALDRLAASLREKGQLQPIQLRWDAAAERFVVLMGERRWRAAQVAGMATIRAVVREDPLPDAERLALQLIENCMREDLTAIEQATAFRTLMDGQGWTAKRLASELSVSEGQISRALSLLDLPTVVQSQVDRGELPATTAQAIARLDDPREQAWLANVAVEQGLTRGDVEKQVAARVRKPKGKKVADSCVFKIRGYRLEARRAAGIDPAELAQVYREAAELLDRRARGESDAQAA